MQFLLFDKFYVLDDKNKNQHKNQTGIKQWMIQKRHKLST